jgi:repressor LexA
MNALTFKQSQVLSLIRETLATRSIPPTRAEIAARLGFRSPKAAEDHLRVLARKGAIELLPGTSRGIRLRSAALAADTDGLLLPLVGRVAAGAPVLAVEHI